MSAQTKSTVEETILAMAKKHGAITREMVLAEAEKKRSPLHPHFCWDDTKAAREYRLIQAGEMIRKIKVTYEAADERTIKVRQFHHVFQQGEVDEETGDSEKVGIFVTLETAMGVETYRDQVIANCRRDMATFRQKYSALNEVSAVISAIDSTNL